MKILQINMLNIWNLILNVECRNKRNREFRKVSCNFILYIYIYIYII